MAENKEKLGFFGEFKKFIARGSIVDMAVGIIIGGDTAMKTALNKFAQELEAIREAGIIS